MRALHTPVPVLITNLDHQLRNNPTQAPRDSFHQQHPSHRYRLAPDILYRHRYRHRYRHSTQAHTTHIHKTQTRLHASTTSYFAYPVGIRSQVSHLLVRRILDLRPRPEFNHNRRCVDQPIFLRSRPRQSPRYPYFSPVFPVYVNISRGPLFGRQLRLRICLPLSRPTASSSTSHLRCLAEGAITPPSATLLCTRRTPRHE